ncbi:hypothetical protein ACG2F4_07215 [Halalkalibaculum sp. DA3122]|uniref:hypothetical protein n=1 Tax=Halalkalibaculum sp. DA3122 TaxID=3373607 RepID=UPI003754D02B
MRLTDLIEDPGKRWDADKLNFEVLTNEELERIIELTEIDIQHKKDPETNRPMSRTEKIELNKICRQAANNGKRMIL